MHKLKPCSSRGGAWNWQVGGSGAGLSTAGPAELRLAWGWQAVCLRTLIEDDGQIGGGSGGGAVEC